MLLIYLTLKSEHKIFSNLDRYQQKYLKLQPYNKNTIAIYGKNRAGCIQSRYSSHPYIFVSPFARRPPVALTHFCRSHTFLCNACIYWAAGVRVRRRVCALEINTVRLFLCI